MPGRSFGSVDTDRVDSPLNLIANSNIAVTSNLPEPASELFRRHALREVARLRHQFFVFRERRHLALQPRGGCRPTCQFTESRAGPVSNDVGKTKPRTSGRIPHLFVHPDRVRKTCATERGDRGGSAEVLGEIDALSQQNASPWNSRPGLRLRNQSSKAAPANVVGTDQDGRDVLCSRL